MIISHRNFGESMAPLSKYIVLTALCFFMAMTSAFALSESDKQEAIKQGSSKWMKMTREAEVLRSKGQRKEAIAKYKSIIDDRRSLGLKPSSERVELAKVLCEDKNKTEAEKLYKEMIAEAEKEYGANDPFLIFPLTLYSEFLAAENRPAEATKIKEQVKRLQLKETELPVAEVKAVLANKSKDQNQKAQAMLELAQKFTQRDRDSQAVYCFDAALKLSPKNAQALSDRGEANARLGKDALAKKDYDAAIAANPNNSSAHFRRALWYDGQEKVSQALTDFDAAIKSNDKDIEALGWRGKLYARLGKNDKAVADFTTAIKIDPTTSWPHVQRGLLYQGMNRFPEAIDDFTTLVTRYPQSTDYLELRADALAKSGKISDAIKDLDEVIKLEPEQKSAVKRRAELAKKVKSTGEKSLR